MRPRKSSTSHQIQTVLTERRSSAEMTGGKQSEERRTNHPKTHQNHLLRAITAYTLLGPRGVEVGQRRAPGNKRKGRTIRQRANSDLNLSVRHGSRMSRAELPEESTEKRKGGKKRKEKGGFFQPSPVVVQKRKGLWDAVCNQVIH